MFYVLLSITTVSYACLSYFLYVVISFVVYLYTFVYLTAEIYKFTISNVLFLGIQSIQVYKKRVISLFKKTKNMLLLNK